MVKTDEETYRQHYEITANTGRRTLDQIIEEKEESRQSTIEDGGFVRRAIHRVNWPRVYKDLGEVTTKVKICELPREQLKLKVNNYLCGVRYGITAYDKVYIRLFVFKPRGQTPLKRLQMHWIRTHGEELHYRHR